tara:strand:- start:184 stop:582 length:399 start_codon:yes stop_codon:yes gene_type:complete
MGGRMRILSDTYTVPATGAAVGDVIVVGNLPKGARIWDAHLGVNAAVGTGPTSIGTRITDSTGTVTTVIDSILAAASHNSNFNRKIETGQTATTASVVPLSYPDGAVVIVTNATTVWTAGRVWTCTIHYTID